MFKCKPDLDIESFLHNKSLEFETSQKCRVYLILSEEQFLKGSIKIEAYFTISLRSIIFSEDVSKGQIKRIAGYKDRSSYPLRRSVCC